MMQRRKSGCGCAAPKKTKRKGSYGRNIGRYADASSLTQTERDANIANWESVQADNDAYWATNPIVPDNFVPMQASDNPPQSWWDANPNWEKNNPWWTQARKENDEGNTYDPKVQAPVLDWNSGHYENGGVWVPGYMDGSTYVEGYYTTGTWKEGTPWAYPTKPVYPTSTISPSGDGAGSPKKSSFRGAPMNQSAILFRNTQAITNRPTVSAPTPSQNKSTSDPYYKTPYVPRTIPPILPSVRPTPYSSSGSNLAKAPEGKVWGKIAYTDPLSGMPRVKLGWTTAPTKIGVYGKKKKPVAAKKKPVTKKKSTPMRRSIGFFGI